MELTLERAPLVEKLKICADVASAPNTACQLSPATGELHVLDATRNIGAATRFPAQADAEGDVILPVKLLSSLLAQIDGKEVVLTVAEEGNEVVLGGGKSKYSLRALTSAPALPSADEFPSEFAEVDGAELLSALGGVIYAASKKDARPILTGISFKWDGEKLELCATDAYRLAVCRISGGGDERQIIFPQDALQILVKILQSSEGKPLKLAADEAGARLRCEVGDWTLVTRLLGGTFPPYERLFPTDDAIIHKIAVDISELQNALKMVKPLVPAVNDDISLTFGVTSMLRVDNEEMGTAEEKLEKVEKLEGEWPEFAVKVRYPHLVETLSAAKTERITIQLQAENKALLLNSGVSRALIMPA